LKCAFRLAFPGGDFPSFLLLGHCHIDGRRDAIELLLNHEQLIGYETACEKGGGLGVGSVCLSLFDRGYEIVAAAASAHLRHFPEKFVEIET
jgi:hypothetical protein